MCLIRGIGTCAWRLFLLAGIALSGAVWSVCAGVGPLASKEIEIGNVERPLRVTLHKFVLKWEYEHNLVRQPAEEQPVRKKHGLFGCGKKRIVKQKVSAGVPASIAWIPLPDSWRNSLVLTITNAHMDESYFGPPLPKPTMIDMVAKD